MHLACTRVVYNSHPPSTHILYTRPSNVKPPTPRQLEPEHTLQLLPGERCLSAAWQNLAPEPPLEPHRTAAALLTTRRLLLVSGDLRVLAEVPTAPEGGVSGVPHAVTSFVWAGPALLYMTTSGQVRRRPLSSYVRSRGRLRPVEWHEWVLR